jgi:phosphoribosyl 1,2-cyclic phosphodiesterase
LANNNGENMALTFCSFSSGSSGNCYLVQSDEAAILIDAGISGRKIFNSLKNTEVDVDKISAVLITHEHTDHIRSLRTLTRKMPHIRAYANRGTWEGIRPLVSERQQVIFKTGEPFAVNDIEVKPFLLSHDAREPVGFSFFKSGKQISILTDTGILSEEIHHEIKGADILVIEANHDVEMLRIGRYPYFLKRRILGEKGHLSNVDAADAICKILSEKKKERHVLLAHLSKENNFPEMAYQTIKNLLEEKSHYIDSSICLGIISGEEASALYSV